MNSLLTAPRTRSLLERPIDAVLPSTGVGKDALLIEQRLKSMRTLLTGAFSELTTVRDSDAKGRPIEVQLCEKAASLKRLAATVAMHLDAEWRGRLFTRLDQLLDPIDWESDFELPSEQSFSTFLRMIIYLHPTRWPGIGLSAGGHFLASWVCGSDRIIIECLRNDEVRWVLSRTVDGDRESGAGKLQLHRIPEVTAGYHPEPLFNNGEKLLA